MSPCRFGSSILARTWASDFGLSPVWRLAYDRTLVLSDTGRIPGKGSIHGLHKALRWRPCDVRPPVGRMRHRGRVSGMENPMGRPFYGEYAWAYDLLVRRPVGRECACIAALLSQRDIVAGARILDAGCGTGRYTMGLARRGYLVTGLDRSAALIAEAQKRVSTTDLPVAFAVGDILALPSPPLFDGILCRGVLNDLLDEHSRQEVFFSFARILRPRGVLILDVREWHATARRRSREPISETSVDTARGNRFVTAPILCGTILLPRQLVPQFC